MDGDGSYMLVADTPEDLQEKLDELKQVEKDVLAAANSASE